MNKAYPAVTLFMNLKPTNNRILIRLHFPDESVGKLVLPDPTLSTAGGDKRTLVECLAVADGVTCCSPSNFLLLRPDANMCPTNKEPAEALIDAGTVLAIVLDDVVPTNPN